LLRNFEPFSPHRHGSFTALMIPIRTLVEISGFPSAHALVEAATGLGQVTKLIHAAGVSPSQTSIATILKVDLHGTALA
jgi:hypothetical protein